MYGRKVPEKVGKTVQEFYKNKKVLVTGHTGFKGTWLCWLLSALGAEVYGFALPPQPGCLYERAQPPLNREILTDIRDRGAVQTALARFQPDLVFHLAAHAYLNGSYEYPADIFEINVMGTVGLLEAIRVNGCRIPIVVVTSDKCYAQELKGVPCREDDPFGAAEAYSTSKACQDLVAQSYGISFANMAVATARASNTIGGGDFNHTRLIPYLLDCFAKGRPAQLRSPGFIRPWQYVLDVLWGYLIIGKSLAEGEQPSGVSFNFGPAADGFQSVGQVAEQLASHFSDAHCVWQEGVHSNQTEILRLDSTKAQRELGWIPVYSLNETLAQTADFHKKLQYCPAEELCCEQIERFIACVESRMK